MQPDLAGLLDGIGPRVRSVRQDRGLTLDQIAGRTGLSVSTLSRLESGKRRPSLELLIPVARVLRVALDDIVAAPLTGDPRVHLQPIRRQPGDVVVPLTKYPGRVQVYKQVLAPRDPELVTHSGSAWLYVLSGQLRLIIGDKEQVLGPGETAEFDTAEPHWFGPAGEQVCELLHLTRHEMR